MPIADDKHSIAMMFIVSLYGDGVMKEVTILAISFRYIASCD